MKARTVTIELEVMTDMPVSMLKNELKISVLSQGFILEVVEKPKINVIQATKRK